MNRALHSSAVEARRWVLGLFLIWRSFLLFREIVSNIQVTGHIRFHTGVLLGISALEMIAAAMFLVAVVETAGGYLLLAVFALAAVVHILHGEFNMLAGLAIYGLAVAVCLTNRPHPDGSQS
jgi:hypothetical protein